MNISAIIHESKSRYAYAYDKNTLHIRIKTGKGDAKSINLRAVDPFNWVENADGHYVFDTSTIKSFDMKYEGETETHDVWFAEVSGVETSRIRYAFIINDKNEETYIYGCNNIVKTDDETKLEQVKNYFNFPYLNEEDIYKAPSWVRDAVFYQITATCFSDDGNEAKDNTSGNFKGLIKKLDYIVDMGYTAIYFTPIFEGYTWHLYDTTDYFNVSKKLGGNEDFREFIEEAHKRGLKVMLDAVFNHCGPMHPFWQDVLKNGKNSEYYDCFYIIDDKKPLIKSEINADGTYEDLGGYDNNIRTFGYTTHMPKLNTGNKIMREHLLSVAKYWVEEFGIDGWRLDVSNEVSHDFWREFRKVVKGVNPEVYIMGENWDDSYAWLQGDQFDSVMNYGFMNPVWAFIAKPKFIENIKASGYKKAMVELFTKYQKGVHEHLFNLIDSHDTDRITGVCDFDEKKIALAYVLLMTYSGAPCVYYGDEIGLAGEELANRIPMIWEEKRQNLNTKELVKKLISIRKGNKSLRDVDMEWVLADDFTNTIIFKKSAENISSYVIVHNNDSVDEIDTPKELKGKILTNLYTGEKVTLNEKLTLKPYEFMILN